MNTPKFSIVIPVYNAQATLPAAIASVLDQTDSDWELILIDDGSADGSLMQMLSYSHDDARIRSLSQANKGPSIARNLGAELARGEFLAFLDADDVWDTGKLAAHRAFHAENPHIMASFARVEFRDMETSARGSAPTLSTVPTGPLTLPQVIAENPVCTTSNLVIRRDVFAALGGFCPSKVHAEDQEFVARAIDSGIGIAGIDAVLVRYCMTESGLSADLEKMFSGWRVLAQSYADRIDLPAAEAVYYRYLARRALRTGASPRLACHYMFAGLRLDTAAFLADRRRGVMTVLGTLAALAMPQMMRRRVFA